VSFAITREAIDAASLRARLEHRGCGAMVCFEGWVRDHSEGREVLRLDYEAYETLAQREGDRILAEARERFGVAAAACVHRVGTLEIGDCAVWVGVSSAHRSASFEACRYIIDEVKVRVPIWKKELFADGAADWVERQACSQAAGSRAGAVAGSTDAAAGSADAATGAADAAAGRRAETATPGAPG
jgi:molybdopterin synthase catalytic subunit